MGNDTKWADVAHYYVKSPISVLYKSEPMSKLSNWSYSIQQLIDSMLRIENGVVVNPEGAESLAYTPILRHLEDMTEAECFELASLIWGESDLIPFTRNDSQRIIKHKDIKFNGKDDPYGDCLFVVGVDGRASSWPIRMNQMTPQAVHWLISRGFDLFGLIESGQAIRKEAGNGL